MTRFTREKMTMLMRPTIFRTVLQRRVFQNVSKTQGMLMRWFTMN